MERPGSEPFTPEQLEPSIEWARIPKNTQRVLGGFLQELQTPSAFSDFEVGQTLYEQVVDTIDWVIKMSIYEKLSNPHIAESLGECVITAREEGKLQLANFLNAMRISVRAISQTRRKK